MGEKRRGCWEWVYTETRSALVGIIVAALVGCGISFVVFAMNAWQASPWASGLMVGFLLVAGAAYAALRAGRPAAEARRKRADAVAARINALLALLGAVRHLRATAPDFHVHGETAAHEWGRAASQVLQEARGWAGTQSPLPRNIAAVIHNPSQRPERSEGFRRIGDLPHLRDQLALIEPGLTEAIQQYCEQEGVAYPTTC